MKILDKYILKSYLITFTSVFVILFFIFVLQGIWLFISELAGKDLDFIVILKFLAFYAPTIVPLVLPLSVLLAAIMTFGTFSENYEFAAMKSSGISLNRAMKFLTVFICGLALVAFFFSNNVIPRAQYKFLNLRKDIVQQKPAMAIVEGQFNQIGTTNIKVDKKTGDKGQFLEGITLHKKNIKTQNGASVIINAKNGLLRSDEEENLLILELYDGNYYEDLYPKKFEDQNKNPFAKSSFKKYILTIDIGKLDTSNDTGEITNTNNMLNVNELNITIDSLQKKYNEDIFSFSENITQRNAFVLQKSQKLPSNSITKKDSLFKNILDLYIPVDQKKILDIAINNTTSMDFTIKSSREDLMFKKKNINQHWIAIHEKFMLAFSCLLMFFIGAPLGAIIRKGGLGLPMVFATMIFITFYFINTFGKKLAQEDSLPTFLGTWLGSIILLPLAILLTYRATNDIGIMISFDWITDPIKKLFSKSNSYSFTREIVSLEFLKIDLEDKEFLSLKENDDNILKSIVKNSDQYNYTNNYRLKALKILESRGITQEQLKLEDNLYNSDFLSLRYNLQEYNINSKIALVFYVVAFILPLAKTNLFFIIGILALLIFYVFVFKSSKDLNEISKKTQDKSFVNTTISIIFGFPFYIFIYIYNLNITKKVLKDYNK